MNELWSANAARSLVLALLSAVGALGLAGCVGPEPSADINSSLSSATGSSQQILFQADGGPIDVEGPVDVLTMDAAVRAALRNDPRIQASLARVRIALADAQQARLLPNPIVAVAFRFPEGSGKPIIEASLTAELLSILQRPRRASAADHRLRAACADAITMVLDTIIEVQVTYVTVQSLDAKAEVLEQRQRLVRQLLDLATSRMNAGEASRLDVLVLDNERLEAETDMIEASDDATQERSKLARLIGNPSGTIAWTISAWQEEPMSAGDEKAWVSTALRHRPEIQAKVWELAALGDEAALASWSALDGLGAGVDSERDGKWTVGPAISSPLPLFDWGQAKRARVSAEQSETRHKLTQARREVVEEVRRALASLTTSRRLLTKVKGELLPIAQQRHEQAQAAYKAGAADITTLIQAEQGLLDARSKRVESERKYTAAQYQLYRAAGAAGVVHADPTSIPSTSSESEESLK